MKYRCVTGKCSGVHNHVLCEVYSNVTKEASSRCKMCIFIWISCCRKPGHWSEDSLIMAAEEADFVGYGTPVEQIGDGKI